jgi:hypothetical protein
MLATLLFATEMHSTVQNVIRNLRGIQIQPHHKTSILSSREHLMHIWQSCRNSTDVWQNYSVRSKNTNKDRRRSGEHKLNSVGKKPDSVGRKGQRHGKGSRKNELSSAEEKPECVVRNRQDRGKRNNKDNRRHCALPASHQLGDHMWSLLHVIQQGSWM